MTATYIAPVTDLAEQTGRPGQRLGRSLIALDPLSRGYPAAGVLFAVDAPLRTKTWLRPSAWNQGNTSQCVLYTVKGLCCTRPFAQVPPALKDRVKIDPAAWYPEAQDVDEWPGRDYDGTSVLAGMKIAVRHGYVRVYRWCFGLDDVLRTLSHHGPVAAGLQWHDSMFSTDPNGVLKVDRGSPIAGGHAIELIGIDVTRKQVVGVNSWGRLWGSNGRFKLSWDDLGWLLKQDGEAVTADMEPSVT